MDSDTYALCDNDYCWRGLRWQMYFRAGRRSFPIFFVTYEISRRTSCAYPLCSEESFPLPTPFESLIPRTAVAAACGTFVVDSHRRLIGSYAYGYSATFPAALMRSVWPSSLPLRTLPSLSLHTHVPSLHPSSRSVLSSPLLFYTYIHCSDTNVVPHHAPVRSAPRLTCAVYPPSASL